MLRYWIYLFTGLRVIQSNGSVCFWHWPFYSGEMEGWRCKFEKIKIPMLRYWISSFTGLRVTQSTGRVCFGHCPFCSVEMEGRRCKFEKIKIAMLRYWIYFFTGLRVTQSIGRVCFGHWPFYSCKMVGCKVTNLEKLKYRCYGTELYYSGGSQGFWVDWKGLNIDLSQGLNSRDFEWI